MMSGDPKNLSKDTILISVAIKKDLPVKINTTDVKPLNKNIREMSDMWGELESKGLYLTDRDEWGCTFTNVMGNPEIPDVIVTKIIFI